MEQAKQRTDIIKLNVSKDIEPQEHACMEPVSAIGMVQDGKTILYSCTQAPFEIRSMLAKILDKPEEDIRVIVTPLGGGFGKKCDSFLEAPAVVAAHACGKPIKITLTRKEDLILTTKRHGYHTDYEIGFTPGRQVPVSGLPDVLGRRTVRVRKLRHADDRRADERRAVHYSQCQGGRLSDSQ